MSTMRRSRSLNELPGHLRVPILRRQDTERTRARLEAGAAGVQELRDLREQQKELVGQAMATAQPRLKQRHGSSLSDHHRIRQQPTVEKHQSQQMKSSWSSPLSTWHSACSLASISEEWDHTLNASTNKNAVVDNMNDHIKTIQSRNVNQNQNECIQYQNFSRGRSQSVHGDFLYFPGESEKKSAESKSSQSTVNDKMMPHDSESSKDNDICLSRDIRVRDMTFTSQCMDVHSPTHTSINRHEQKSQSHCKKPSVTSVSSSCDRISESCPISKVKSQSMSWDDLLAVIGMQNENSAATNESMQPANESHVDVFTGDKDALHENTKCLTNPNDDYLQAVQRKKVRSQSFTPGCWGHQGSNQRLMTTPGNQRRCHSSSNDNIVAENVQSETVQGHYFQGLKHFIEIRKSTALLRRASIQCEAVLTQTTMPRKIINPLQDVDINSLKSPGPLHAVTLQYSSLPMRELSDNILQVVSKSHNAFLESFTPASIQSTDTKAPDSLTSTSAFRKCPSKIESHCDSVSICNSKHFTNEKKSSETFPSEEVIVNTHSEIPVPKPRTSICKEMSPHTAKIQNNSTVVSSADRTEQMTPELLQKSEQQEKVSQSTEFSKNASQINNELHLFGPASDSHMLFKSTVQKQKVTSSKSVLENTKLLVKNQVRNCSFRKAEQCCSGLESGSDAIKTNAGKESTYENSTPQKVLTVHIDCARLDINKPDFHAGNVDRQNMSMNKSASMSTILHKSLALNNDNVDKDRSKIYSNTVKKQNHGDHSKLLLLSKTHYMHTQDVSILSDEGYSTCGSISSQRSQLTSVGSLQSCDIKSISSSSFASINESLKYSHEKSAAFHQKQCMPSGMKSDVKYGDNLKKGFNKSNKEMAEIISFTGNILQVCGEQYNADESKQTLHQCPKDRATSYNSYYHQGKLAKQVEDTPMLNNQHIFPKENAAVCSNIPDRNESYIAPKTKTCNQISVEVMSQSNNAADDTNSAAAKTFKQTSV